MLLLNYGVGKLTINHAINHSQILTIKTISVINHEHFSLRD